jgi:phosphoribosyl 1,2-cyclic phosphodiesterase
LVAAKCAHVHGRAGTDWRPLDLGPFRVQPLPASHDAPGCHGFAVSAHGASYVHMADVGYLTDGHLAAAGSADTLALEFNHDLDMLYHSGRPPWLIERIRGRSGHLSNAQAIDALTRLRQEHRLPRQVLALHLSDECNHPTKAHSAVRHVLSGRSAGLFQCVPQHQPLSWVDVGSV